jgi:hypothetical protein
MRLMSFIRVLVITLVVPSSALAAPIVIDFDALADGEAVTDQFLDILFSNATVITAGVSLNEFELPPLSGSNVIFDSGGSMRIDFSDAVTSVGGYFTYLTPLVMTAFDSTGAVLGVANSLFVTNLALSGETGSLPNELIQLTFDNISYVTIAGDPSGGSFTLDDLTLETPAAVPEPGTLSLMLFGGAAAVARLRHQRSARRRSLPV